MDYSTSRVGWHKKCDHLGRFIVEFITIHISWQPALCGSDKSITFIKSINLHRLISSMSIGCLIFVDRMSAFIRNRFLHHLDDVIPDSTLIIPQYNTEDSGFELGLTNDSNLSIQVWTWTSCTRLTSTWSACFAELNRIASRCECSVRSSNPVLRERPGLDSRPLIRQSRWQHSLPRHPESHSNQPMVIKTGSVVKACGRVCYSIPIYTSERCIRKSKFLSKCSSH